MSHRCPLVVLYLFGLIFQLSIPITSVYGQDASKMPPTPIAELPQLPAIPINDLHPLVEAQQVYTPEHMLADAESLQHAYPGIIEVRQIGKSREGRPLIAIRIGNGPLSVALNGAHHGREWLTSALLMQMIDRYALAYYRGETIDGFDAFSLLNHVSLWVVPMVNPDGVAISQCGTQAVANPKALLKLNGGSDNFIGWKSNARGVDLNRQYPAAWKTIDNPAPSPGPGMYKGVAPMVEPEVVALRQFVLSQPIKAHVAFHSAGEIIYWHFKQRGALYSRSAQIARRLHELTGYQLVPPQPHESGGGYKDWVVLNLKVPAYTLEVGAHPWSGPVPLAEYPRIWRQTRSVGLLMAQEFITQRFCGYINRKSVASQDNRITLQHKLQRMVERNEGTFASVVDSATGKTVWHYPTGKYYRVVIDGETLAVAVTQDKAERILHQQIDELHYPGGCVIASDGQPVASYGAAIQYRSTCTVNSPTGTIGNTAVNLCETPRQVNGVLIVPLTWLAEATGKPLTWDKATALATLTAPHGNLILPAGSRLAFHDNETFRLSTPTSVTAQGNMMVPLRELAERLGAAVTWDERTMTVTVQYYSTASPQEQRSPNGVGVQEPGQQ